MADEDLTLGIGFSDEDPSRPATKSLSLDFDELTDQFKKKRISSIFSLKAIESAGTTVITGAAGAVVAIATSAALLGSKAINDYRKLEESEIKLKSIFSNRGVETQKAAQKVFDFANSMQEITTFSRGTIIEASALIAGVTGFTDSKLTNATKIAIDLAATMGEDLSSAAIKVGRALNDPAQGMQALARSGVVFTENQKKYIEVLVASGRIDEARSILKEDLEGRFGGVAEQMAQGTGAFTILTNELKSLSEEIGRTIAPELIVVAEKLTEIAKNIRETSETWIYIKAFVIGNVVASVATFQKLIESRDPTLTKLSLLPELIPGQRFSILMVQTAKVLLNNDFVAFYNKAFDDSVALTFDLESKFAESQEALATKTAAADFAAIKDQKIGDGKNFLQLEQKKYKDQIEKRLSFSQILVLYKKEVDNNLLAKENEIENYNIRLNELKDILITYYSETRQKLLDEEREKLFQAQLTLEEETSVAFKKIEAEHKLDVDDDRAQLRKKRLSGTEDFLFLRNTLIKDFADANITHNEAVNKMLLFLDETKALFLMDASSTATTGQISTIGGIAVASVQASKVTANIQNDIMYKIKMLILLEKLAEEIAHALGFFSIFNPLVWYYIQTIAWITFEKLVADSGVNGVGFNLAGGSSGELPANVGQYIAHFNQNEIVITESLANQIKKGGRSLQGRAFGGSQRPMTMAFSVPSGLEQSLSIQARRM